jgi:hypothetical protein
MRDAHDHLSSARALPAFGRGLAEMWRRKRLVLIAWACFLVLAWVAALPAWRWWDAVLATSPEGDRLLDGLNSALMKELFQYDRSPTPAIAVGSAWTFMLLALIANPFVAGGIIGVLTTDDATFVARAFVRDGMRFYWRFSRVLLMAGLIGLLLASLITGVLQGIASVVADRGWEIADMWLTWLTIAAVAFVFGITSLSIDLARLRIAQDDEVRTWRPFVQAVRFLVRRVGTLIGLVAIAATLLVIVFTLYLLISSSFTPHGWPLILFAIVCQQAFSIVRTALRVSLLASLYVVSGNRTSIQAPPPALFVAAIDPP